jgi:hypothetical protein
MKQNMISEDVIAWMKQYMIGSYKTYKTNNSIDNVIDWIKQYMTN